MDVRKKQEGTQKKFNRRDALKFAPVALLGAIALNTSQNSITGQSLSKVTSSLKKDSGSNVAPICEDFFYNTKVIFTVFNKQIKKQSGYSFNNVQRVKSTTLVKFSKKSSKDIELYLVIPQLMKLNTPYKGKSVQIVEAPGTIIRGNKQKKLIEEIIFLLDQNEFALT